MSKFVKLCKAALLGILLAQTASGAAIQGQSQATNLYGKSFLQVPLNQATNLGANKALIETGNLNFMANPGAEGGATGCTPYNDASGAAPSTGSGATSITVTCTTTTGISGAKAFYLQKPASNAQGQGWAFPFTIDASAQAKMLQVSFDYKVDANYVVGSDTTTPDLVAYVYGPTDGTPLLTQLTPYKALGGSGTLKFQGNFQTAMSGTAYRLILHEPNTGTLATNSTVDNIVVSPVLRQFGTPVTDWTPFTPTWTGTVSNPTLGTTTTNSAFWRRVGDSMEIAYTLNSNSQTAGGTGGSGVYLFSLPSGYSIDSSKVGLVAALIGNPPQFSSHVGSGQMSYGAVATSQDYALNAYPYDSTHLTFTYGNAGSATSSIMQSSNVGFGSGGFNNIAFTAKFPIQGWSSSTQMSDQSGDNRIITARATLDATPWNVANNTTTLVTFDDSTVAPNFDPVGAYNSSTGKYTFNSPGYYHVYSYIQTASATGNGIIWVYKNGAIDSWGDYSAGSYMYGFKVDTIVKAVAGDYIQIYFNQNSGGNVNIGGGRSYFTVQKLQGNQQIQASETVSASYTVSASQTVTAGTAINFDTKVYDSHNAVTTNTAGTAGGWKFTAPSPGKYSITMWANSSSAGLSAFVDLYKNGTLVKSLGYGINWGTNTVSGAGDIQLNTGDFIDLRPFGNTVSVNGGNAASHSMSFIDIKKVAN